jgi:HK97 family phage major capsid protein
MPWKVFSEEGQFCIHKLNADDTPGEKVACHPTQAEADAQLRALYANEPKSLVKAIGETADALRIGGYGVVWGGADLVGDTFTKETNLWLDSPAMPRPMLYEHAMNPVIGMEQIGTWNKATVDDTGLWIEGEIAKSQRYYAMIKPLLDAGVIGLSSGAVPHMVTRENGKLKSWGVFEWSLTPQPCEPRTLGVVQLRSFAEAHPEVKAMLSEDVGDTSAQATKGEAEAVTITKQGDIKMPEITQEQLDTMIAKAVNDTVKAMATPKPEVKAAEVKVTMDEGDQPFETFADQLKAVHAYSVKRVRDPRLGRSHADATKVILGLNEGVDSEGAFALQDNFAALMVDTMWQTGQVLSKMRPPIPLSGNNLKVPYIRDSAGAAGTRFGGMRVYKVGEGQTITAAAPAPMKRLNLELTKYACLYYASEELIEDSNALANILQTYVPMSIRFDVENDVINEVVNPLGIMASGALVSVAKEANQGAATVVLENIVNMWSRLYAPCRANAVWLVNQDVEPQLDLLNMTTGMAGFPVFLPAGGISGAGFDTIKGRPVVPVEYCQTVGSLGDIILADLTQVVSADKGGVKASSSIHVQFATDQQAFKFTYRFTAAPGWDNVYTPLNSALTLSPFVALAVRA